MQHVGVIALLGGRGLGMEDRSGWMVGMMKRRGCSAGGGVEGAYRMIFREVGVEWASKDRTS